MLYAGELIGSMITIRELFTFLFLVIVAIWLIWGYRFHQQTHAKEVIHHRHDMRLHFIRPSSLHRDTSQSQVRVDDQSLNLALGTITSESQRQSRHFDGADHAQLAVSPMPPDNKQNIVQRFHSRKDKSHPIRIAYIFAGSARSFICPKVHWTLRLNVIDAFGGEPYVFVRVSEEDNMNTRTGRGQIWSPQYGNSELNETLKILNPRKVRYFRLSEQEEEMKRNFPNPIHRVFRENDLRRYSMFYHRCMGYRLAREWEEEHGMRFDWVALIRLDAAWLEPVLPIQYYANDRVWLTETGYAPFNDQFMLIPRQYSDYLFDLNTKVRKEVYCLGGPDVEKWKCNATELTVRKFPKRIINETLSYCCPDVFGEDMEGFSEYIHHRHFAVGKIPVSLGRFTVYLARLNERQRKVKAPGGIGEPTIILERECYGDCHRLHYLFKDEEFYGYANYTQWKDDLSGVHGDTRFVQHGNKSSKTDLSLDSRHILVESSDPSKCGYVNHAAFHWKPITVTAFHRLQQESLSDIATNGTMEKKNANISALLPLNYSRNFYEQWDLLPESVKLNPIEFQVWEIHPVTPVDACLTLSFLNKTLHWESCNRHFRVKGGRRNDPGQAFQLLLRPSDPALFYKHPMVEEEDVVMAFHMLPLPDRMRIAMLDRDQEFLDIFTKLWCWTVIGDTPRVAEVVIEKCSMNDDDPRQWFFTVNGTAMGSHDHSLIGTLQSYKFPDHCVMRSSTKEMGVTNGVQDSKLRFGDCKDNQPVQPDLMRFEFVLAQP
jgi:hypothetical protein